MKPRCPEWVHDAVFYEIYPQTFFDSNDDGIGDLPGIISKLDYVKSLGVNAIWLNPCFVSPFRDAGYDIADYYKVAPRYGTNADMKKLFQQARKRGLRVILDLVPGHTSIDHDWFKESSKPKANKYSDWYIWTDNTWDMGGQEFAGKMIHGYSDRNGNYLTNFFWSQPALNFGFGKPDPEKPWQLPVDHDVVQEVRDELKNIMRFWLDMGASGFRVDMAGSLIRRDPENQECITLWREVRSMLDKDYPDAFMVSEWSWPPAAVKGGFHADFLHWCKGYEDLFRKEDWRSMNGFSEGNSFFDKKGKGSITDFLKLYTKQLDVTKKLGYISIPVGNHDLSRINIKRSDEELEVIFAFQLAMPGVPFIYYGDEIGMRHLDGLQAVEGCYRPRSGARTPMQWESEINAGFSKSHPEKLWLPIDPDPKAPNVAAQEDDPDSLLNHVRELIKLRRSEPALTAHADFTVLYAEENKYPFVFLRKNGKRRALVALNPSGSPVSISVKVDSPKQPTQIAGFKTTVTSEKTSVKIDMKGCSYGIFLI